MNVDEAMAYTRRDKDQGFWSDDMHNAMVTLATEVERLRAKLAAVRAELEEIVGETIKRNGWGAE